MIRATRNWWRQAAFMALGLMLAQAGDAQAQFGFKGPKIPNPVKPVQTQASKVGKQVSNTVKSMGSSASKAGKSAISQAEKLGQTAKSTATSASNTAKKYQSQASNSIGQTMQSAKKQASNFNNSVNNTVRNTQQQNQFGDFMKALNNANNQIKPQGNPFQSMQNQASNGFRNTQNNMSNGLRNTQNQFHNNVQTVRNQTSGGVQAMQRHTGHVTQQVTNTTRQLPQQLSKLPNQMPSSVPQLSSLSKLPGKLPSKLPVGMAKLPTSLPGNLAKLPSLPKTPSLASVGVPKLPSKLSINGPKVDTQIVKDIVSQPGKDLATLTQKSGEALVAATTKPLEPILGMLAGGQVSEEELVTAEQEEVLGQEVAGEPITEETTAGPDPLPEEELVEQPVVDPNAAALDLATAIVGLVQTAVANGTPETGIEEVATGDQGQIAEEVITDSVPVEEVEAENTVVVKNLTDEPVTYSVRRAGSAWGTYTLPAGEEHKFVIPTEELEVQYIVDGQETPISVPVEHIYAFALDNGQLGLFLADPEE